MDLLKQTKELCRLHNIKPARRRGQNFLVSDMVYEKVIAVSDLDKNDIVLEIGPGFGFLTARLARRVKRVAAVEIDGKLVEVLRAGLSARGIKNVKIVNEDILKVNFKSLIFGLCHSKGEKNGRPEEPELSDAVKLKIRQSRAEALKDSGVGTAENGLSVPDLCFYKIVANLPYNIASNFLRKFLTAERKPSLMVLMLQKEMAERICAPAGEMSLLSVSVQFYAEPRIVEYVSRDNFWPAPEVDSAIIKIKTKKELPKINEKKFFQMVKFAFGARRKMLKNNLAAGYRVKPLNMEKLLKLANLSPNIRAQELSLKDWFALFGNLKKNML